MSNQIVLRPDEFLAEGGEDCEDWSLVTAGLLRFWGWECYVGSIGSPDNAESHAVCLVRMNSKPSAYSYYEFEDSALLGGMRVRAGYYVPIDYEHVGSLSNAVGRGWRLRYIREPVGIYGVGM